MFFTKSDFVSGGMILIVIGALLAYFRRIPFYLYSIFERCCIVRIEIYDEDESFQWIRLWLAQKLKNSRSVSAFTRRGGERDEEYYESSSERYAVDPNTKTRKPYVVFTPAPGVYFTSFKGKFCIVRRSREEKSSNGGELQKPRESFTIQICTRKTDIARELIEEARDIAIPEDGKVEVRTVVHHCWKVTARLRPRPIESVILHDDLTKELLEDIKLFRNSAKWYTDLGVPYRRGYLLYGPAGSGKTSLIFALASELNMNICVLGLSSSHINDSMLISLLSNVDHNSIVLIEDIDCAFEKREKGSDRKNKIDAGLTFSGLLNALDGIVAQDGRMIFMTTNHPEKLDSALIRPGRADFKAYIGNAEEDQIYRLFKRFYNAEEGLCVEFSKRIGSGKVSMAAIQNHLIVYRNNPILAVEKCEEILPKECVVS